MNIEEDQMKSQEQNLISNEANDSTGGNKEGGEGQINNSNDESNKSNKKDDLGLNKLKKKNKKIDKALAIRMYSILLCHTGILTLVQFIINIVQVKKGNVFNEDYNIVYWVIFLLCLAAALGLSMLVTKIKCFSNVLFIYIFYVALLAFDLCIFNIGGFIISFDIFASMLLIFDAGTIVILLLCSLIKEAPSTFWLICTSIGGIILTAFLCTKIYEENSVVVLIFCVYAFVVYESMNYNAFYTEKKKKKKKGEVKKTEQQKEEEQEKEPEVKIPPMMILPYEFNASFIKIILYILKGIYWLIKGCCGGK